MLPKKFDAEGIKRFYSHNLLGLLITIEVWIVIYNIYFWLTGSEVTFDSWFEMATFSKVVPLSHWWYMPQILSMYLALPFVGIALQNIDSQSCGVPLVFVIVFAFVMPTINKCYAVQFNLEQIETTLTPAYLGGAYLTYAILGYLLFRKKILGGINGWVITLILLLSSFLAVDVCRQPNDVWYDALWVLLSSVCIAELIRRAFAARCVTVKTSSPRLIGFVTLVSRGAFGIYLVHNPIKALIAPFIPAISSSSLLCLCLFAATWVLSVAFVLLIFAVTSKAPKLRRVLLDA